MKINSFLLLFAFFFISQKSFAISSRIDFQVHGLENAHIIFACQYGEKQLVIDTIELNAEAKGFFESKQRLTGGIYVVVFPNGKYFELLINNEQFFSLITDTTSTLENMIIEGAEETEQFSKYQLLLAQYQKNKREGEVVKNKIDSIKTTITAKNQDSFFAKYLLMQQDPELPQIDSTASGKELFLKKRKYLKDNYFEHVNFNDIRVLRTRLLYEKLTFYFNVLLSQHADSINFEMDKLLSKAKPTEESYRYVLNFLINNYKFPKKPYQEKALVHLADNYYLNGKATWADPRFLAVLQERTNAMRPNLTGVKAANLLLQTPEGEPLDLYKINSKYLLVFFFSADCNVCIEEAQQLNEQYLKLKKKGLEVLAVYTHADKTEMMNFINNTRYKWKFAYDPLLKSDFRRLYQIKETPTSYLLDRDKIILEKNVKASRLELKD